MAKRDEIVKAAPQGLAVPEYLAEEPILGMDEAKRYIVHPRAKVVQKSAQRELLDKFPVGSLILTPSLQEVARMSTGKGGALDEQGPAVYVTPLYFFAEWATWNPIALRGTEPTIAYRTRDPNDPVVAKARDRKLRMEPIKDGTGATRLGKNQEPLHVRHVEHLCWIMMLHNHEVREPFVVSFSRGEHFSGTRFAGLVRRRNASVFGCVFEMRTQFRPDRGQGGDWYGIELQNPGADSGVGPWVDRELYPKLKALHLELVDADRDKAIRADLDEEDAPEGGTDPLPAGGKREM